jgi:hypothetical protein
MFEFGPEVPDHSYLATAEQSDRAPPCCKNPCRTFAEEPAELAAAAQQPIRQSVRRLVVSSEFAEGPEEGGRKITRDYLCFAGIAICVLSEPEAVDVSLHTPSMHRSSVEMEAEILNDSRNCLVLGVLQMTAFCQHFAGS